MRGKLIVLEGGDGSGKATQTKLLSEAMERKRRVSVFDFPRYASPYGKFIKEALSGKHGDFVSLSPYFAALPYALDRAAASQEIKDALKRSHVICNRYT